MTLPQPKYGSRHEVVIPQASGKPLANYSNRHRDSFRTRTRLIVFYVACMRLKA
jgi:hypothetical protein